MRNRQRTRTVLLALAASVALFWGAVDIVGVPATRLARQLVWVTLGVVMLVATAALAGWLRVVVSATLSGLAIAVAALLLARTRAHALAFSRRRWWRPRILWPLCESTWTREAQDLGVKSTPFVLSDGTRRRIQLLLPFSTSL